MRSQSTASFTCRIVELLNLASLSSLIPSSSGSAAPCHRLMKRLAEVEEVADLLLYLESADFVNGEVVHLDGGAHAGKW
jgi:NAD(P)-dependent dehydrogenase (short-subunit alcohol dehydrogenase family)